MRREALTFVGILLAAMLLMATLSAAKDAVSEDEQFARNETRHTLDGLEDAVS